MLRTFPYIGSPVAGEAEVRQLVHTPTLVYYRVVKEADWLRSSISGTLLESSQECSLNCVAVKRRFDPQGLLGQGNLFA